MTHARPGKHLKFLICARRRREDTQERYFYEWGNIHVSLMLTTPPIVMEIFKRYVQHYAVSGITDDMLVIPRSHMEWDNMADHWVEDYQALVRSLTEEGYVQRMQPHAFGDKAFNLALCKGETIFEEEGFRSGGVKLIHWFKKRPELSIGEFKTHWRERYAPAFMGAVGRSGLVRKYVVNYQHELDQKLFKGTLFEHGGVGEFQGVEEIWFDSVESLARLRQEPKLRDAIKSGIESFVEPNGSFSMVTTERVVYDYVTPSELSPPPAILNPDSLEAKVIGQGYRDWNIPKPVAKSKSSKRSRFSMKSIF